MRTFTYLNVKPYVTGPLIPTVLDRDLPSVSLTWPVLASGSYALTEYRVYTYPEPFDLKKVRSGEATLRGTYSTDVHAAIIELTPSDDYPYFLVVGVTAGGRMVARTEAIKAADCLNVPPRISVRRPTCGTASHVWFEAIATDPDGEPLTYDWIVLSQPDGSNPSIVSPTAAGTYVTFEVPGIYELRVTVRDPYDGSVMETVWYEYLPTGGNDLCFQPFFNSGVLTVAGGRKVADLNYGSALDDFAEVMDDSLCLRPTHGSQWATSVSECEDLPDPYQYPVDVVGVHLVSGDMDGDGFIDVAALPRERGSVGVYRQITFPCKLPPKTGEELRQSLEEVYRGPAPFAPDVPWGASSADVDHDGLAEILAYTLQNRCDLEPGGVSSLSVIKLGETFQLHELRAEQLLEAPITEFMTPTVHAGRFLQSVPQEDLQVVIGPVQGRMKFLRVDVAGTSATFAGELAVPAGTDEKVAVGDLNRDHFDDLVIGVGEPITSVQVALSDGAGGYESWNEIWSSTIAATAPILVDISGDGLLDVAFISEGGTEMTILENSPSSPGTLTLSPLAGPLPYSLRGDGVIASNRAHNLVPALLYQTTKIAPGLTGYFWGLLQRNVDVPGCRIVPVSARRGTAPFAFSAGSEGWDASGATLAYSWRVVETGQTGTGPTFDVIFTCPGFYYVELRGEAANGQTWTDVVEVVVVPAVQVSGPAEVCAGGEVTLDAGAGYSSYLWSPGGQTTRTISVSPSATTTYSVTVTDALGCSATSKGHTVTVNPVPAASIVANAPTSFCEGGSVTLTALPEEVTVMLPGAVPLVLRRIPAGTFMMGSPIGERGSEPGEQPQHQVTLTKPFYIGKYEVTQLQWKVVMGTSPSYYSGCGPDCPVERISWDAAGGPGGFIERLNQLLGTSAFRLPTEAEWEQAARAGTTGPFSFGDDPDCSLTDCSSCALFNQHMWWCGDYAGTIHPVGQTQPNPWGLFDMHGNVAEWTNDRWSRYPETPQVDPTGSPTEAMRVYRDCAAWEAAGMCRSAARRYANPSSPQNWGRGFRVAMTAGDPDAYLWSTGATTQAITVTTSGSYTVQVTDANGCSATSEATVVTVHARPTPTISGPSAVCAGGRVTLDAGAGYSSYAWSTGATTQTIEVSPSETTIYTVTVTNAEGCSTTSAGHKVAVNPLPTPAISGPSEVCAGGSVVLDAGVGYSSYPWSTGATTRTIEVSPSETTIYTVEVTTADGCSGTSAAHQVTVYPLPEATITPSGPTTFCEGGSVTLTASGGTSWLWSTGATTQAITVTTSGSYTVQVTDASGCSATSEATVVTVLSALDVTSLIVEQPVTITGCGIVNLGPAVQVVAPGELTVRAGTRVVLRNGFSVMQGARFVAGN